MSKTIKITKQAGEVLFRDYILEKINAALNLLPNGQHVITIKKDVKRRSLDQNSLAWLYFTCIERETGQNKQDVHDYYCTKFLKRSAVVGSREVTVVGGTSKLNTLQFSDFIDKVIADAATEFGICLPDPNSLHFEDFINEYEGYL